MHCPNEDLKENKMVHSLPKPSMIHSLFVLARISNLPTVWTNCLAAWAVNASVGENLRSLPEWIDPSVLDGSVLPFLLLGGSLLYAGGCTLNDAFDYSFDLEHNPDRPLPSGVLPCSFAWTAGIVQMLAGGWIMIVPANCSVVWVGLLVGSIIAYDYLHKKWIGSMILMGACRFLLWASAATAGGNLEIRPQTWIWATTLACYVIGITWFARGESKPEKTPARISILLLFGSPLVALAGLIHWNNLDPVRQFLVNLCGLFVAWIVYQAILRIREPEKGSIGEGVSRLLAGICVTDAVALAFSVPLLAGPCIVCTAGALFMQKRFAAT